MSLIYCNEYYILILDLKEDFKQMDQLVNIICAGLESINNIYLCKTSIISISNISSLDLTEYAGRLISLLIDILASEEANQELKPLAITAIGDIYLNQSLKDYIDEVLSMLFSASEAVSSLSDKLSIKLKESIIACLLSIYFINSSIGPRLINIIKLFSDQKLNPSDTLLYNCICLLADIYLDHSLPSQPFIIPLLDWLNYSRNRSSLEWAKNILYNIK
jgi:hypothetical protein